MEGRGTESWREASRCRKTGTEMGGPDMGGIEGEEARDEDGARWWETEAADGGSWVRGNERCRDGAAGEQESKQN